MKKATITSILFLLSLTVLAQTKHKKCDPCDMAYKYYKAFMGANNNTPERQHDSLFNNAMQWNFKCQDSLINLQKGDIKTLEKSMKVLESLNKKAMH